MRSRSHAGIPHSSLFHATLVHQALSRAVVDISSRPYCVAELQLVRRIDRSQRGL